MKKALNWIDKRYVADLHLGHTNIIRYCERPFKDVGHMNSVLIANLLLAEAEGAHIHILGDLAFNFPAIMENFGWLQYPENHVFVLGNHDRERERLAWERAFGLVVGTKATWREHHVIVDDWLDGNPVRVILSHEPQRDLRGADYNLYGHHHNDYILNPAKFETEEWKWLMESDRHIITSVEMTDYRPRTLAELIALHHSRRSA